MWGDFQTSSCHFFFEIWIKLPRQNYSVDYKKRSDYLGLRLDTSGLN